MKKLLTFAAGVAAIAMSGCGGNGNDNATVPGFASIRVVNAVRGTTADVSFRDARIADNLAFDESAPEIGEAPEVVDSGNGTVEFFVDGEVDTTLSQTLNFEKNRTYTAIFAGLIGNIGENAPRIIVVSDAESALSKTQVNFRFVHASPAITTPVDVYIVGPDQSIEGVAPTLANVPRYGTSNLLKLNLGDYRAVTTTAGTKTILLDETITVDAPGYGVTAIIDDVEGTGGVYTSYGADF